MSEIKLDDERDNHVGVLTNTDENPVLHAAPIDPLPQVLVNWSLAREETGARCIGWGRNRMSAAEARGLAIVLNDAAGPVADLRAKLGYDT